MLESTLTWDKQRKDHGTDMQEGPMEAIGVKQD